MKILGGEGANRLHRVLRSERGLTYGASADTEARKQAGDFVAETDTRTETTGEALRLMVDEISRLQRERVFERELADAQAYLAGSFPLTIETPERHRHAGVERRVLRTAGGGDRHVPRARAARHAGRHPARRARSTCSPDRLSMVLVGNAAAFVPQLRRVGFTDFEVIPIEQLDLMSATLRREQADAHRSSRSDRSDRSSRSDRSPAYTRTQANAGERAEVPNAPNDPNAPALVKRVDGREGRHRRASQGSRRSLPRRYDLPDGAGHARVEDEDLRRVSGQVPR